MVLDPPRAMEYLMSYGWAFLIFITIIGTLVYFGIPNFNTILPERIVLPEGFTALDYKATSDSVILVIQNGKGQDVVISNINITANNCAYTSDISLKKGDKHTFNINCPDIQGNRLRSNVEITYRGESGLSHIITGNMITKIEKINK